MKSIKQIRDNLETLSENVESASEMRKLTTLVRAGLFDANKLTMLKRALNKDNVKMTKAERETLLELLDKLLNLITSNQQVFMKVKQNVSEEVDVLDGTEYQELDESSLAGSSIDINKMPPLIIMRRRAIRVFPDGQKVALYWADKINKFISVPFEGIGISEAYDPNASHNEYISHMKTAAKHDEDSYEHNVARIKADQALKRIRKKGTPEQQARAEAAGSKIMKRAKEGGVIRRTATAAGEISSAAGGGVTGAGAAIGGLAGSLVNKAILKPAFKGAVKGAKALFKEKIEEKKSPIAEDEASDMIWDYTAPFVSSVRKLAAINQAKKKGYITGDEPDIKELEKDIAVQGLTGLAVGGALSRPLKTLTSPFRKTAPKAVSKATPKPEPIIAKKETETSFQTAMKKTADDQPKTVAKAGTETGTKAASETGAKAATETGAKTTAKAGTEAGTKAATETGAKAAAKAAGVAGIAGLASILGGGGSSSSSDSSSRGKYAVNRGTRTYNPFSAYRERKFSQSAIAQEEVAKPIAPVPQRNPFKSYRNRRMAVSMAENALFDRLKTISESKENYTHIFEDGSIDVTPVLATKLLETYSALNSKNKGLMQEMINKDKNSFIKAANFSVGK